MLGGTGSSPGAAVYQLVFDSSAIGLSITDMDGRMYPNQALAEMLGYERSELVRRNWKEISHPDDVAAGMDLIAKLVAGTTPQLRVTHRYLHRTGKTVWAEVSVSLMREKDGAPAFMIVSLLDVSSRRRVEEELILRGAMLATEQEALPEGILAVDAHGHVLSYNRRFLEICGIPKESADAGSDDLLLELAAKQIARPEEFRQRVEELYRSPLANSQEEIELKDGRTIERVSMPMLTAEGANLGRLWCFRDVSERKRTESTLRERLGELERWQDLMLDREDRVAELKREVNELCGRLGEAVRYPSQDFGESGASACKVTGEMPQVVESKGSDGEDA